MKSHREREFKERLQAMGVDTETETEPYGILAYIQILTTIYMLSEVLIL